MTKYNVQRLIPRLLEVVPELKFEYEKLRQETAASAAKFSKQDIQELREIAKLHNLPETPLEEPGITLVVEDSFVPYIMDLAVGHQHKHRLQEIMNWVEELAASSIFEVRNVVAVSICEPLITSYQSKVKHIYSHIGEKTKELCVMQFPEYKINQETKKLFGVS